jgi:hypothetical protein
MLNNVQKFNLSNLAIATVLALGVPAALLLSGFCLSSEWHEGKAGAAGCWQYKVSWLSSEDAIDAVIDAIIKNAKPALSREDFHRLNPDCCKIAWMDHSRIGFVSGLLGQAARQVRVKFADGDIVHFTVTNCGRVHSPAAYFQ